MTDRATKQSPLSLLEINLVSIRCPHPPVGRLHSGFGGQDQLYHPNQFDLPSSSAEVLSGRAVGPDFDPFKLKKSETPVISDGASRSVGFVGQRYP